MIRYASALALIGALTASALPGCQASTSFNAGGADQPAPPPPPPPPPPPATAAPAGTEAPAPTPAPTTTTPPPTTPATDAKPSVKGSAIQVPGQLEFETGSAALKQGSDSEKTLESLRAFLADNPRITKLRIEGHTDNVGSAEANEKLSGERALTIKKWLVDKGIAKDRLVAAAFGQSRPVADNSTEEGRAKNRRTEFKIAELGGKPFLNQTPAGGGKVFDF
jgi:OmpA-OmpF porin, OOP family